MFNGKPINELDIEDLKQMLVAGRRARQYALDHYEELAAREAVYTLHGPMDYAIGAAIPGHSVSKSSRKLTLKTRRKEYILYELDRDYKLLRAKHMYVCSQNNCTYHCFELEGIRYACPFKEQLCRTVCKVFLFVNAVISDDLCPFSQLKRYGITKTDRLHIADYVVKAVVTLSRDVKMKIDFCVSVNFYHKSSVSEKHPLRYFITNRAAIY